jgi:hypothetical protein
MGHVCQDSISQRIGDLGGKRHFQGIDKIPDLGACWRLISFPGNGCRPIAERAVVIEHREECIRSRTSVFRL